MSLKAFHIVFIGCATVLAVTMAVWLMLQPGAGTFHALAAGVALAIAAGLVVYGARFLKKTRHMGYL
jgi:hypothetical protein